MKKILLASVAAVAFVGGPAVAADIPVKARPVPVAVAAVYNWSGCYIGVAGGYQWGRSRHTDSAGVAITNTFDVNGGIFGGTLGCQVQSSAWVFGIEGDGSWSGKKGSAFDIAPFNTAFISETREKWLATVRGRLGWANGPWLLYATGGLAIADVEINVFNSLAPAVGATEKQFRTGWTVGGGAEWGWAPNLSVKAEYLYVDFGNKGYFSPAPTCCVTRGNVSLTDHIFRVGLNYRFGGGAVVARY